MPEVYSQIFPFFHHHMTCVQEKSTIIILSSMSHIYILIVEVCLAVLCYDNISFSWIKTGEYFASVRVRDIFKFVWECKVQLSNICFTLLHVIQFVLGWVVDLSSKLLAGKKIVWSPSLDLGAIVFQIWFLIFGIISWAGYANAVAETKSVFSAAKNVSLQY